MSDDLPMGWVDLPLELVGMPSTPNIDPSKFPNEVFELYSVPAYADDEPEILPSSEIHSVKQSVETGDVLLCKIVPHLNRVWIVKELLQHRQIASGEWIVIRSKIAISDYLRYVLTDSKFRSAFMATSSGVGGSLMRARPKAVAQISIPIAPVNEQLRIVDKLDRIGDRHRTARNELNHIPKLITRYKQAVLAAACSGKLTEDWRIKLNLEDSWQITNLGSLIKNIRYGTSKKCDYAPLLTPVLRIPNIGNGYVIHSDIKYAEFSPNEVESLQLHIGDILIIRSNGSVDLVGKSAIVSEHEEGFLYAGYLIRLRPKVEIILPKYFYFHLIEPITRSEIESRAKSTSGVNNINSQELQSLTLNIPSLEEQKEIVRRVEKMFKKIDMMEQEYQKAAKLCDRLEQATLAKAFRGELVPQDPDDEPASVLLEQVKRESQKEKLNLASRRKTMTNRELLKQHIDQLDDTDIQQISQFVEFLRFCHQKNQSDRQPAQALKEDPLIGLFAGSPDLATQSEAILNQNIQTNSGWTWKPSSQIQDL